MISIVVGFIGVLFVALAYPLFKVQRKLMELERRVQEREERIRLLQQNVSGLSAGAGGVADYMVHFGQDIQSLQDKLEQIELRGVSGDRPYMHAIRLVQRGAAVEDLVASCGLARGEAELILQLHGIRKAG